MCLFILKGSLLFCFCRNRTRFALPAKCYCSQLLLSGTPCHGHRHCCLWGRGWMFYICPFWSISHGHLGLEKCNAHCGWDNPERMCFRFPFATPPTPNEVKASTSKEHPGSIEGADCASYGTPSKGIRMQHLFDGKRSGGFQADPTNQVG